MENPLPNELSPSDSTPTVPPPDVPPAADHVSTQAAGAEAVHSADSDNPPADAALVKESPTTEGHAEADAEDDALPTPTPLTDSSGQDEHTHLEGSTLEQVPPEPGTLEHYAHRAGKGRLNPEEEAEATGLLRESLMGGRSEVARAVAVAPRLPWTVTVQATAAAWPEIKPTFRAQLLAGLARTSGEAAARIRLSLARGLFKVDSAASLKLILLTLKLLRDKQTGLLEGKGASMFSSVLIGRGKAWILQVPLGEMKPAEADLTVFAALHGAFHQPQAPLTQLSIVKWAAAAGRLANLPPVLEQMVLKGVSRWSGKWQMVLRREVSPLPDSWIDVLKSPTRADKSSTESSSSSSIPGDADEGSPSGEDPRVITAAGDPGDREDLEDDPEAKEREDEEDRANDGADDEDDSDADGGTETRRKPHKQRPVYVSKTVPSPAANHQSGPQQARRGSPQPFNLQETLRQVEQYVGTLRNDLQTAQKQLRQRDDERRQRRTERPAPLANPGELSLEEAIRLNHQLESRNAELQSRIDELTVDSEARAASRGLVTDTPVLDPESELRTLLGFKLKEDFEDFQALEQEARDLVVQQHYRTVLRHVFEVLEAEGVRFEAVPTA